MPQLVVHDPVIHPILAGGQIEIRSQAGTLHLWDVTLHLWDVSTRMVKIST
jgi:hypothetical protein